MNAYRDSHLGKSALKLRVCMGLMGLSMGLLNSLAWAEATVSTGIDEQAQLPYWELRDGAMSLRLVQRLPDQTRAYFMARGFSAEQANLIAANCVFQSIYKNLSGTPQQHVIAYDLTQWRVHYRERVLALKLREDWEKIWQKYHVKPSAQIAFTWSLLPTRQRYQAKDYNWGMTLYGLEYGNRFDLTVVWQEDSKHKTATIKNIQCAPDIHPEPQGE